MEIEEYESNDINNHAVLMSKSNKKVILIIVIKK
jgi:hypothetical protein